MNNVLITGGAGFIGSNFIKNYLSTEGNMFDKIVILDLLTYAGDINRIKRYLNDDIIFIEGNICDEIKVDDIFRKYNINYVINFAAETHVDNSINNQHEFINTNILGVQNLIDIARKNWDIENSTYYKFIQISTDEVYGSSNKLDNNIFDEESPLCPGNPYAATKASAEHLISAFNKTFKFPSVIIRSSNNYGISQNREKLIPKVIYNVLNDIDIPMYGDGSNKRNWLNVVDNSNAILEVLKSGEVGEVYNISGNCSITNLELVHMIISHVEEIHNKTYKGKIKFVNDRPGHDYSYRISGKKIKMELGFVPEIEFKSGLYNLIKSYQK